MRLSFTEDHSRNIPEPQPSGPTTPLFDLHLRYNYQHHHAHAGKVEGRLPPTRFSLWIRRTRAGIAAIYTLLRVEGRIDSHKPTIYGFRKVFRCSEPPFDMKLK
jgi:hypothetical protein